MTPYAPISLKIKLSGMTGLIKGFSHLVIVNNARVIGGWIKMLGS